MRGEGCGRGDERVRTNEADRGIGRGPMVQFSELGRVARDK
jgi:hypothetical protein